MNEAQLVSDGQKAGLIFKDFIYIIERPYFSSLKVQHKTRDHPFMDGSLMSEFERVEFDLSFVADKYFCSENINKELLDFGLVNQMTVNQLFKEINKKLDKRK